MNLGPQSLCLILGGTGAGVGVVDAWDPVTITASPPPLPDPFTVFPMCWALFETRYMF